MSIIMRKEPFSVGSYVHVMKRGARGAAIVRDDNDRWRFLKLLHYLNDAKVPRNWERDISSGHIKAGFSRPEHWPKAEPYVGILAFCLLDNHFHVLMQELQENGIPRYMQRLCTSMALCFNTKYDEQGTLFQSAYQARTVENNEYLQYLWAYIQVKNTFEIAPQAKSGSDDFDELFSWAQQYPFSSLMDYAGKRNAQIIEHALAKDLFPPFEGFKKFAEDVIKGRYLRDERTAFLEIDSN